MQAAHELELRRGPLNIEIYGFPEVENETLLNRVNEVAQKLKVPVLSEIDVRFVHRLS